MMVVLTKASDYTYEGTKFCKGVPAKVSAEVESYLIGTGYFEKADDPAPATAAATPKTVSKPAAKKPAPKVAVKTEEDTEE